MSNVLLEFLGCWGRSPFGLAQGRLFDSVSESGLSRVGSGVALLSKNAVLVFTATNQIG